MLIRIKRKQNGLSGQTVVQELLPEFTTLFSVNSYNFIFVLVLFFFYCVTRILRYLFVNNTVLMNTYISIRSHKLLLKAIFYLR